MVGFVARFFGKKEEHVPFDLERAVGRTILRLPRCSDTLVVAGPEYDDPNYAGDVFVEADGLLPWAEHHAETTWISNDELQTALKVLPIWLRSADLLNHQPIVVDQSVADLVRAYIPTFVNMGIVSIYCRRCDVVYKKVEMEKYDDKRDGPWHHWTDEWRCPAGHLLYHEHHRTHIDIARE